MLSSGLYESNLIDHSEINLYRTLVIKYNHLIFNKDYFQIDHNNYTWDKQREDYYDNNKS